METASILRSFHGAVLPNREAVVSSEKPFAAARTASFPPGLGIGGHSSLRMQQRGRNYLVAKAAETASVTTTEKTSQVPVENKSDQKSTFPSGFEALILNVCDETSIAELKVKVGTFEMHLKRDIERLSVPVAAAPAIASPTIPPPIPSEPMVGSAPVAEPVEPKKSAPPSSNPFANVSSSKASKLAALEASGAEGYVVVSSPAVGSFCRGRTVKEKKQPPCCKEGDIIKEGQTIGYLNQFGNELPIRSDAAGEVLKILFKDGEAVGYGDPVIALLPSFHGINK